MRSTLAFALVCLALVPAPGLARDALPWKDANPVGGTGERAKARPAHRASPAKAAPTGVAAAGPATDVPLPEARPAAPADPAPVAATPAAASAPPAGTDAPKPEARPADAPSETANEPVSEPRPEEAEPAADRPASEIPVPDQRPAPTPAEAAPEPAAPAIATVPAPAPEPAAPPAGAEVPVPATPPAKPEDAPNSTEKLKSREPEITPAAAVEAAAAVEDAVACEGELKARGVVFTVEETISEGECGVLRPVALKTLSSGIDVSPKTQMLCRTALALDEWMTQSVVPATKADLPGETLAEFRHASTYVCRPRASESGISEHARGSAIDIGSFVFKSGREIGIAAKTAGSPDETFLEAVRAGACGPFKTVLGPGTDADHATHFHLDIAARAKGATYCK